nr:MAG TPA: hypothetical protein [Caudoviricetes sp.]
MQDGCSRTKTKWSVCSAPISCISLNQSKPNTIGMCHISHTIRFCSISAIGVMPVLNRTVYFLFPFFNWKYLCTTY